MKRRRRKKNPIPALWTGAIIVAGGLVGGWLTDQKVKADVAAGKVTGWPAGSEPGLLDPIWTEYVYSGAAVGAGAGTAIAAALGAPVWELGLGVVGPAVLGLFAYDAHTKVAAGQLAYGQQPAAVVASK